MTERIVAAALRVNGEIWSLPPPVRHNHLTYAWSQSHWVDDGPTKMPKHDSGFLTSEGRFVERIEAVEIAVAAGQIDAPKWPPRLYSEDLW